MQFSLSRAFNAEWSKKDDVSLQSQYHMHHTYLLLEPIKWID